MMVHQNLPALHSHMEGQCMGLLPLSSQSTRHPEEELEVATEVCA
jgi:hypothetical protein